MRIVRTPFAVLGTWFIVAGILLGEYGREHAAGSLMAFGLLYAAAGAVLIALSFRRSHHP